MSIHLMTKDNDHIKEVTRDDKPEMAQHILNGGYIFTNGARIKTIDMLDKVYK
jgi:hypothetical protein